jgi:hypothetical protein
MTFQNILQNVNTAKKNNCGAPYFIIDDNKLYVHKKHPELANGNIQFVRGHEVSISSPIRRNMYYLLKRQQNFFEDCLETAEDLINNSFPDKIAHIIRSKVKDTNQEFGNSNENNIAAAKKYLAEYSNNANEKANPNVNEAYVIVSQNNNTKYPYHAAAVIAKDGDSNITLEVFAANEDAQNRNVQGTYHEYTSSNTFHNTWAGHETLSSGDPVTIVIVAQ